ncbi:MAG: hypothetical protein WAR24_09595, partial [Candidatus Acidiferrales bacterium]
MDLTALYLGPFAEHLLDPGPQRLRTIDDEQIPPILLQPSRHQVLHQRLHDRRVFRRALPQPQNVLLATACDPQRYHQHLFADLDPVDQHRHQIQFAEFSLAQLLELRRTGLHEFSAHAALFDPVAIQYRFHRAVIVPRCQPGDDAFPHRSLPSPVVLQSGVAVQRYFLAFARAYP